VAVIEATKGNLEVQGFGFRVDKDEAPRKLIAGVAEERSPPGAVTLNQGQALIVPLRLELRYDLEEDLLRYVTGTAEESGQIFNAIRKLPSDVLRFQGYEYFPSGRAQLREIFSKRKDEFRRPETSRITQTYVVGPAYELIDLALKGQRIPVRRAPASAVAYLGTAGIGSCPFLFFDQGESIIAVGRVLVGAHNKTLTKTEEVLIPDGARFAYISEQEPELTHLERVGVRTMGLEKVLAEYISIGPGRAWRIEIPEGFRTNGTLFIRGYYHPLRELVSIDSP
jgi:hypothetical protein